MLLGEEDVEDGIRWEGDNITAAARRLRRGEEEGSADSLKVHHFIYKNQNVACGWCERFLHRYLVSLGDIESRSRPALSTFIGLVKE